MRLEHTQLGKEEKNRFPELEWSPPAAIATEIKEYLLIVEDVDVPLPLVSHHGVYHGIPPTKTHVISTDFVLEDGAQNSKTALRGGFKLGLNMRGSPYGGPRPPLGHGPHRYFYQVIALKDSMDATKLSAMATRKELAAGIVGKVAAWGVWIGVYEQKWD